VKFIVDTAFDLIGAISAALKLFFVYLLGYNTDLAAAGVITLCLLLIIACHDFLFCGRSASRSLLMLLTRVCIMVTSLLMASHIIGALFSLMGCTWLGLLAYLILGKHKHTGFIFTILPSALLASALLLFAIPPLSFRAIPLDRAGIRPDEGFAYKFRLAEYLPPGEESCEYKVIRSRYRWSATFLYLVDRSSKQKLTIQEVRTEGKGAFRLKGDRIWFSTADGSSLRDGGKQCFLVCKRSWLKAARSWLGLTSNVQGETNRYVGGVAMAFLGWALLVCGGRIRKLFRLEWLWLRRQKGLFIVGTLFLIGFGAHQWRFLHHDHRMQMVTSRDDDGYMMERLGRAYQYKTMDPARVQNNAYGAIGYYPYAFLPFVVGKLERPITIEMTNIWVRGLKTLISLGMLASVWLLAERHFGRVVAICATLLMATNQGFLAYSSFPFYPDVCMAMFSTLSLCFILDLVGGWNERSFFLALGFAAMSVSIKFLTFLLFPFLAAVGTLAVWRLHEGHLVQLYRFLIIRAITGAALCIAVFFLCNPYLDYNIDWITPNYKMASTSYSVDTPNVIAGQAATISNWLSLVYMNKLDSTEMVAATLALLGLPCVVLLFLKRRFVSRTGNADRIQDAFLKILTLTLFAASFQVYLMRSVTIPNFIDARLLLPLYPLLFVIASWMVVRLLTNSIRLELAPPQAVASTASSLN
jgi:hypothetical protein